jgi:hypothetical protein
MAERIKAIGAFRPRIKLGKRALLDEVVRVVAARSTLNEGELLLALREMRDVVGYICTTGRPVHLDGLGTYTPKIKLDGSFNISHRLDPKLKNQLNIPKIFSGDILNRDMIGKTPSDIIDRWNLENPTDQVV